ncbi:unnamed protein product [Cylindrotheca closterium]|uniref:RING-type domain-containing protein n=1 Tax=Cylindrotheca closterium TaxID=2856 RepID=A0AAD2G9R3_9STRA|nr:unnamed protein product [Cylindrotheca closterium]
MVIDAGVSALMAGPLVVIVCCAGGLRTYFHWMNRRLRSEVDGIESGAEQPRIRPHRTRRDRPTSIDLDKIDTSENGQDIIRARQTRTERMMGHFLFGVCVKVDGHMVMANSEDGSKDIEATVAVHAVYESSPQEKLPADEYVSTKKDDSTCGDECCAICLEPYAIGDDLCSGKTEKCSHVFHEHCLIEWIRRHNRCPLCRSNLMPEGELRKEVV